VWQSPQTHREATMAKAGLTGTNIILGKLTLGNELGRGGYGIVHEATVEGIDHKFAIKLLHPSVFADPDSAKKRFLREANVLFKLRHQYITPIYGVGEHEGRPYILMEHYDGVNL